MSMSGIKIFCAPQMSASFSGRKQEDGTRKTHGSEVNLRPRDEMYRRIPLKDVVADCERRWFEATLKAAKTGDVAMQCLVGQMFCTGYGVASDLKKGKLWLRKSASTNEDAYKSLANLSVGNPVVDSDLDSNATVNSK